MIIVTLSVVCTLKGTCQHILFALGGVEIHEYNRSKQCRRCQNHSTDFKALNAMYVYDMSEMVFAAFMQMYTDTQCTAYMPVAPPRGRAPFKKPPSCGFSGSPPCSPRRQLC